MSKLLDFLTETPVDNITEEVPISPRFKDEDGQLMRFTIKAMSSAEYNDYQKQALSVTGKKSVQFDAKKYNELVIINHTVDPNFKDAEAIKKAGCLTPDQFLNRVLLAGEAERLVSAIADISGINANFNEVREEAKN